MIGSRTAAAPVVLALATALAVAALVGADVFLNDRYARTRDAGPPVAWATLVWAARADLLVLLALAGLVGWQLAHEGHWPRLTAPAGTAARLLVWLPGVGLAVVAGVLAGPVAGAVAFGVSLVAMRVGPWLAGTGDGHVQRIMATALTLRIAVALGLGLYGQATHEASAVLDDEVALDRAALELGAILAVGKGDLQSDWWHLPGPYLSAISAVYWLVARDFVLVRLVNAGIGTLAVAIVYGIARVLFGASPARLAGWLVALWPSFVFWTATGLREAPFAAVSLLIPWLLARTVPNGGAAALVRGTTVVLAGFVVWTLRGYAAVGLLAGIAVTGLAPCAARARRHAWATALGGVIVMVALLIALAQVPRLGWRGPLNPMLSSISPPALEYRAAAIELSAVVETDPRKWPPAPDPALAGITTIVRVQPEGQSRFQTGVVAGYEVDPLRYRINLDKDTVIVAGPERVQPLTDANVGWDVPLARVGDGLRLLVVPPAPWESLPHVATIPDALAWDALAVVAVYAAFRLPRGSSVAWLVLVTFPLVMVLALALASSYLGTVVRHRSMLVPWLVILAVPLATRSGCWPRLPGQAPRSPPPACGTSGPYRSRSSETRPRTSSSAGS